VARRIPPPPNFTAVAALSVDFGAQLRFYPAICYRS
jgi:hypothetical protein